MALSGLKSQLEDSDSGSEPEFLQYKVVILGDGTVGKTSLCMSLNEAQFQPKYKQTIGLDFFVKRIELPNSVHVALQIWDIGGQSIGSKMLSTYIYGAHGVVFIYDITNHQSFVNVEEWMQIVKSTYAGSQLPYLALIGNKTDLYHMQAVKIEKHNAFAEQNSMYSYMVSAKTGDQIFTSFFRIAADLSGVVLSSSDIESSQKIIKAEIVTYANEEKPQIAPKALPQPVVQQEPPKKKKKCVVF